jgi:hypothetical protein
MSTLDEIAKEKQRVSEALARVDAQRQKLTGQLSELEATERVLGRYGQGTQARRTAPVKATKSGRSGPWTRAPPHCERKTNRRQAQLADLGDQVLALATRKTQQEIAAACKGARPDHVGVVIARHKRAGRIEARDGRLYATHSAGMEQRAAV